jgi:hypothetical protein
MAVERDGGGGRREVDGECGHRKLPTGLSLALYASGAGYACVGELIRERWRGLFGNTPVCFRVPKSGLLWMEQSVRFIACTSRENIGLHDIVENFATG